MWHTLNQPGLGTLVMLIFWDVVWEGLRWVWNQQNNEAMAREVAFDARLWCTYYTAQRLMSHQVTWD